MCETYSGLGYTGLPLSSSPLFQAALRLQKASTQNVTEVANPLYMHGCLIRSKTVRNGPNDTEELLRMKTVM